MAQTVTTRSEVIEQEYTASLWQVIWSTGAVLLCGLLVYLFHFITARPQRLGFMIIAGAAGLAALVYDIMSIARMQKARTIPTVTVNCPYCDYPMEFLQEPTSDYNCEGCHRHVQYENGRPVPIKMITCAFCKTVHKVSAKARQYTCDKCNRALKLTEGPETSALGQERGDVLQNYDVVLMDVGRQKNEVAMALESILVCNLVEARRQMAALPLTVMRNVPERKADAVRRRLRDLGATAIIRPTGSG